MKQIRILFTGIGRRVELIQEFRNAAIYLNKKLKIYGADSADTAPALAFCDCSKRVCGMKEEGYPNELLAICKEEKIDLVIPTIDTDLLVLSENKGRFEAIGTKVLISDPSMIRICRDKTYTSGFFVNCGLKAPMPVDDWKNYQGGYPAFIKPKDGSSSVNAYKVSREEELRIYAEKIQDYVVQKFIKGREYTVDIFADFEGNPVWITPRLRLVVRAGEVLKTEICLDSKIIRECETLIKAFRPCGPMTVQLIRDEKGEDYYIEINPRFGGGAPLSMKAGAKSVETILKLLSGEKAEYRRNVVSNGAVYSRYEQSVCVKEGQKRPIKGVIFDLDDTLYPEKEYVKSGFRKVAEFLGDERLEAKLWEYFESGRLAIDACLKEVSRETEKEECLRIYRTHQPDIHLYKGVTEQIEGLKKRGIQVGILTDGRPEGQRNKIAALGLDKLISDIIITDELGGERFRKPCDIGFRILAQRWMLPYEALVYVGDNIQKDFQAPRQLGMKWVWVRNEDGIYKI